LPTPNFVKSSPRIEPCSRSILFVDIEEYRFDAKTGQAAQMQVEQHVRHPSLPSARVDRDGENLRLVAASAGENESGERRCKEGAVSKNVWFAQKLNELALAPAATK